MTAAEADQATTPTEADGHRLLARLIEGGLPEPTLRSVRIQHDADVRDGDRLLLVVELADGAAFEAWRERLDSSGAVEEHLNGRPVRVGPQSYRTASGRLSHVRAVVAVEVEHERDPATYARPEPSIHPPGETAVLSERGERAQQADAARDRLALARGRVREQLADLFLSMPPDPLESGPADTAPASPRGDHQPTARGPVDDASTVAMDWKDLCGARARLAEAADVWGDPYGGLLVTDAGVLDERAETWAGGERA